MESVGAIGKEGGGRYVGGEVGEVMAWRKGERGGGEGQGRRGGLREREGEQVGGRGGEVIVNGGEVARSEVRVEKGGQRGRGRVGREAAKRESVEAREVVGDGET